MGRSPTDDLMRLFDTLNSIRTDRLLIRPLIASDSSALFDIFSNPMVTEYAIGYPHETVVESQNYIQSVLDAYTQGTAAIWGITVRDAQEVIGIIGYELWFSDHNRAEIGYTLRQDYWGHGYATEALRGVASYGFSQLKLNRIEATAQPDNTASWHVLQKAGFQREGLLKQFILSREKYRDVYFYSLVYENWNNNKTFR
ncbi:MAG: GNAT family N-acetyltransferase [Candidatus Marinamargulisbacteria bacterium]|nr:GNAT family N-acetyltransferase [Candidatus Marinamargulisbacteria bacterium]